MKYKGKLHEKISFLYLCVCCGMILLLVYLGVNQNSQVFQKDKEQGYRQIENIYEAGLARSIGVCNFHLEHFLRLEQCCRIMPMLHQTELHPLNSKKEIREYCKKNGIVIMAHTPTGRMCEMIRQNAVLKELAKKYNKTIAQIIVRWHYQNGIVPIIATKSAAHMKENADIFDFALSASDMDMIESIDRGEVLLPGNGMDDPRYIWNL